MYPAPNCFFDSQHRNIKVKCGHRIHKSCLHSSLNNNNIMCPLCKKSIIDTTAMNYKIDYEISQNPIPEEYKKICTIYCNDCNENSTVEFHFIGNKCSHCNGYNTALI